VEMFNSPCLAAISGVRKPLLKRAIGESRRDEAIKRCSGPLWLRAPVRVTFEPTGEQKFTFTVRSHAVDLVTDDDEEGGD